jgi:hypothetical protein
MKKLRPQLPLPPKGHHRAIHTRGPLSGAIYQANVQQRGSFIMWCVRKRARLQKLPRPNLIAVLNAVARQMKLVLT